MKIRQLVSGMRNLLRPQASWSSGGSWHEELIQSPGSAGVVVTPTTIMQHPKVFQAVQMISRDIAKLPLEKWNRRQAPGDNWERRRDQDHWIDQLLNVRPNSKLTAFDWKQLVMQDVLTWGNHVSVILPDGAQGYELKPCSPSVTGYWIDQENNNDVWIMTTIDNKSVQVPYEYCFHLSWVPENKNGGFWGQSIAHLLRDAYGHGISLLQHANSTLSNRAMPSGVIHSDHAFNSEAAKHLRAEWDEIHAGPRNSHRIAVLWEGLKFQPISMSNADAEIVDMSKLDANSIASIYNIPPYMLGASDGYQGKGTVEEIMKLYKERTLDPHAEAFRQEAEAKLFTLSQRRTERTSLIWNFDSMDWISAKERAEIDAIDITHMIRNQNEVRQSRNLNPVPGGDEFLNPQPGGAGQEENNDPTGGNQQQQQQNQEEQQAAARVALAERVHKLLELEAKQIRSAAESNGNFIAFLDKLYGDYEARAADFLSATAAVAAAVGYDSDWRKPIRSYIQEASDHWLRICGECDQDALRAIARKTPTFLEAKADVLTSNILEPKECQPIFMSTT